MRIGNEREQGYFGYWQNRFTHHNILTIGYATAECYKQMQQRWVEFQPDLTTQRRNL